MAASVAFAALVAGSALLHRARLEKNFRLLVAERGGGGRGGRGAAAALSTPASFPPMPRAPRKLEPAAGAAGAVLGAAALAPGRGVVVSAAELEAIVDGATACQTLPSDSTVSHA